MTCDVKGVSLVIERYDSDRDGKLSFWEFSNALLPLEPLSRDEIERRKAVWEVGYETKEVLRRVFRKMIDTESRMESIRQKIKREKAVVLRGAFEALDWLNRGYLTSNEFKKAFDWHVNVQESTTQLKQSSYVK